MSTFGARAGPMPRARLLAQVAAAAGAVVVLGVVAVAAAPSSAAASSSASVPAAVAASLSQDGGGLCMLQDARATGMRLARRLSASSGAAATAAAPPLDCGPSSDAAFTAAFAEQPPYWRNKNGDAACSGASRFSAGGVNVSEGPAWSFKDESASIVSAHPVIDGERSVYLSHRNGKIRKFTSQGELVWTNSDRFQSQADQGMVGAAVLLEGALFFGTKDGFVTAVDAASGKSLWYEKAGSSTGPDSWSIAGLAGTIIVPTRSESFHPQPDFGGNDQIVAMSAKAGRVLWRRQLPGMVYNFLGAFAMDPPSILFSTSDGKPYRLRACDGSVLWEGPAPPLQAGENSSFSTGGLASGPGGIAYVTSNGVGTDGAKFGQLTAYKVTTGELVWSRRSEMPANNAPAIGKLGGSENRTSVVIAIGENSGFPIPFAAALGLKFAWKTAIVAFDALTGAPTGWRFDPPPHRKPEAEGDSIPDHICLPDAWSNPAIGADGAVYIGHMSGNVFALRDADGDGRWDEAAGEVQRYYGGRCYQGSPGIAEDMLVTTPCDGMHVFRPPPSTATAPAAPAATTEAAA